MSRARLPEPKTKDVAAVVPDKMVVVVELPMVRFPVDGRMEVARIGLVKVTPVAAEEYFPMLFTAIVSLNTVGT